MSETRKLHGFFRSSASYRVRIALNLKGVEYENIPVDIRGGARAQYSPAYMDLNPQSLVPTLEDGGAILNQSLAILEYLEEAYPKPPLLPRKAAERARVRALMLNIACEIQPLNNPRIYRAFLKHRCGLDEDGWRDWRLHWLATGFQALERRLADPATGIFCHGDTPGLADICLVPQVFNAEKDRADLTPYPTLLAISRRCQALPAFAAAHPDRQPDAP